MTALEIMTSKLKLTAVDPAAELAILETERKVRTFCNLSDDLEIPAALNFTIANMAIDLLKYSPTASGDTEELTVKEVTMGETSYKFDTVSGRQILDKLLLDYESDLVNFRRIRK